MLAPFGPFRGLILTAAVAAALCACAPAKVVKEWSDPARSGPGYKKLLVMGIWDEARPRRVFEDRFVTEIRAVGVAAMPSYQFIPQDGRVSREVVIKAVDESGADAVIITRLMGRQETSRVYASDRLQYGEGAMVDVNGAYAISWAGFYTPPEESNDTVWTMETKVFDAKSRGLVWNGVTAVNDPKNLQKGSTALAQAVVKTLTAKKMLQP